MDVLCEKNLHAPPNVSKLKPTSWPRDDFANLAVNPLHSPIDLTRAGAMGSASVNFRPKPRPVRLNLLSLSGCRMERESAPMARCAKMFPAAPIRNYSDDVWREQKRPLLGGENHIREIGSSPSSIRIMHVSNPRSRPREASPACALSRP